MTSDRFLKALGLAALVTLLITAIAAAIWGTRIAGGVLFGGAWNLASLWCLSRLLDAWLRPNSSRRRAVGWLLLKFPLLYLVVFGVMHAPTASLVGFGAGFTVVLAVVVGALAVNAQRMTMADSYGR